MTEVQAGLTLVLGGTRSGKSSFAEKLAARYASVVYIATAEPIDADMTKRIADHKSRRPGHWRTLEAIDLRLPETLAGARADVVLIDSLALYAAGAMEREPDPAAHMREAIAAITDLDSDVIVVSDEVGLGVVPMTALGRSFRDFLGEVNQQLAEAANNVYLVVAGVPLAVKGEKGTLWE